MQQKLGTYSCLIRTSLWVYNEVGGDVVLLYVLVSVPSVPRLTHHITGQVAPRGSGDVHSPVNIWTPF